MKGIVHFLFSTFFFYDYLYLFILINCKKKKKLILLDFSQRYCLVYDKITTPHIIHNIRQRGLESLSGGGGSGKKIRTAERRDGMEKKCKAF